MLHATDDDPAGLKAAARDYWLLTVRGLDVRQLILTDGERGFNGPADAYSAAPSSLAAALGAVTVAPPLAGQLIAHTISGNRDLINNSHVYALVGVARELGQIIAAAPADQRDGLIGAAAAMLADAADGHPERYLELVTTTTDDAAQSWGRPTTVALPTEAAEQVTTASASSPAPSPSARVAATLAQIRDRRAAAAISSSAADEAILDADHGWHREEKDRRTTERDDRGIER